MTDCCDEFPHEVVIHKAGTRSIHGEQSVGANNRTARAYVPPGITKVRQTNEEDADRGTTLIVEDVGITHEDQIELPDGTMWKIRSVAAYDFDPDMLASEVVIV